MNLNLIYQYIESELEVTLQLEVKLDAEHEGDGEGEPGEQGAQPGSESEPAHRQGNQSGTHKNC